ncbi:MAG TPA: hypothetical protein VF538_03035 [Pyrinomonadaceae bacterium]|jgi:hypothetical protein
MTPTRKTYAFILATLFLLAGLAPAAAAAQKEKNEKQKKTTASEKSKKKKPAPRGAHVLWREPSDIGSRDTFEGPGASIRPDLRRVTIIKKEEGGWSPKLRVKDASGREWVAKMGKEAQPETAAVRLLWAVGYMTEINHLVPCVKFENAPEMPKEAERCEGGGFANVRFEARPKNVKRVGMWSWKKNPFTGTRELGGLKTLMVLINNWDTKDENNVLFQTKHNGRDELHYVISDLGATFGKTGSGPLWRLKRSRNDPEGYSEDKFVGGVRKDGRVDFDFSGMSSGEIKDVRVGDARWVGGLLARLSDKQIGDMFRAANYSPEEVRAFSDTLRRRIDQLVTLPPGAGGR